MAQIAKDIGDRANPKRLASIALHFENTSVRRLGYLLDLSDHKKQADTLQPFAQQSDKYTPLDPSARPLIEGLSISENRDERWRLDINETVEIDF